MASKTMAAIFIQELDEYGHQDVVVHDAVVGSIFRMSDGTAEVRWFGAYRSLSPGTKRTVAKLAKRRVAVGNITRRLTS